MENKNIIKSKSWKIIYIYTVSISEFDGYCKIGETKLDANNLDDKILQECIEAKAKNRIRDINKTAGLNAKLEYATLAIRKNRDKEQIFSDHDFHRVLENNGIKKELPNGVSANNKDSDTIKSTGREWFKCLADIAINFLEQYKKGEINFTNEWTSKIELRKPQKEAVEKISAAYKKFKNDVPNTKKNNNNFLLDCIMRFGKCVTTYEFINTNDISKVLILTHKPVVKDSWRDDYKKVFKNSADQNTLNKNYEFLDKKELGSLDENGKQNKIDSCNNLIYFASIQDMRGIKYIENENGEKMIDANEFGEPKFKESNKAIFDTNWDLIVIDEAHEGNSTNSAEIMYKYLKRKFSLFLSGTAYNLKYDDNYDKKFGDNIYIFDQEKEAECKCDWVKENGTDSNPYENLPDISLNGISITQEKLNNGINVTGYENNYFDFRIFFAIDDETLKFKKEREIIEWLDRISSNDENDEFLTKMPFNIKNRFYTQHSFWLLPSVKICNALEKLLKEHSYFKTHGYRIFNVAGDNCKKNENSFTEIKEHTNYEEKSSIILSVDRLTTGVTLPGLGCVLMLSNSNSPMKYFQTIYRAKNPSPKDWKQQKTCALVFDFDPDRMFALIYKVAKSNSMKNNKTESENTRETNENIKTVLNYYNVMSFTDNGFTEISSQDLKTIIHNATANEIVSEGFKSTSLIDFNKFKKYYKDDPKKLIEFCEKIVSKTGKSSNTKNNNKITDHGLDVAICETNAPEKENEITTTNPDKTINELKKAKEKIKQIINQVFTRIPYMLIGKAKEIKEKYPNIKELEIEKFTKLYEHGDWKEFMQIEKNEFINSIKNFINEDIFYASMQKWISNVFEADKFTDPIERYEYWIERFASMHNPDKETVLTPIKVIKEHYKKINIDWVDALKNNKRILDINSKTALYGLYASIKLYETSRSSLNLKKDYDKIIKDHIFLICKTKLAKQVACQILKLSEKSRNILQYDIYEKLRNEEEIL